MNNALVLNGAESLLAPDTAQLASLLICALYIHCYFGLIYFKRVARRCYVAVALLGGPWILLNGMSVQSPVEGTLGYFLTIGDGCILAMSFFSPLRKRFAKP